MKFPLFSTFALVFISARRAQACCDSGDANFDLVVNNGTRMNPAVFGYSSLPLPTSVFSCITSFKDRDKWAGARTHRGDCNIFLCHCDHCYGESNCKGTDDHNTKAYERTVVIWYRKVCAMNGFCSSDYHFEPCQEEMAPYLTCPARSSPSPSSLSSSAAAAGGEASASSSSSSSGVSCSDKDLVLGEPIAATAARLSSAFCEISGGGKDLNNNNSSNSNSNNNDNNDNNDKGGVGLSFAGQVLASLDADNSGSVSCAEWGIAKMTTTHAELLAASGGAGGYFGPRAVGPPACKMSPAGEAKLAKYNAYLAELTLATAARNAEAWVGEGARHADVAVEGRVAGNALVGAALEARDGLAAKWEKNATTAAAAATSSG